MALRDDLFEEFGPKLLEAVVIDLFENVRELRRATGKPERTLKEFYQEIADRLPAIEPYIWQNNEEP